MKKWELRRNQTSSKPTRRKKKTRAERKAHLANGTVKGAPRSALSLTPLENFFKRLIGW